jgi:hypothetical protein
LRYPDAVAGIALLDNLDGLLTAYRAELHQEEANDRQAAILGWRARRIGRRYLI